MKVHVIGAGIGGLCTAIGLRRIGCEVVVSERSDSAREVGAGISLWSNAMRALETLGVAQSLRALVQPSQLTEFRVNKGARCISRLNLAKHEFDHKLPHTFSMIHRAELVAALVKALPSTIFRWNQTLTDVQSFDDQVTAEFADGSRVMSDLLIGADGIHSITRRHVLGSCRPRYAGYTCYRGICEAPPSLVAKGYTCEIWGQGTRFGVASLTNNRVYWWCTRLAPPNEVEKHPRERLKKLLHDWAAPVPQLLKMTPDSAIIKNDILDHEPQRPWHRGRVGLLGDAAHAVTPNFGQGGCLAIEDAIVFSRLLRPLIVSVARGGGMLSLVDAEKVLAAFEAERFERCRWLARKSNQLGDLAKWSSWWSVALRNFFLGATPSRLMWRMLLRPAAYDAGQL